MDPATPAEWAGPPTPAAREPTGPPRTRGRTRLCASGASPARRPTFAMSGKPPAPRTASWPAWKPRRRKRTARSAARTGCAETVIASPARRDGRVLPTTCAGRHRPPARRAHPFASKTATGRTGLPAETGWSVRRDGAPPVKRVPSASRPIPVIKGCWTARRWSAPTPARWSRPEPAAALTRSAALPEPVSIARSARAALSPGNRVGPA